ncbi:glycosyltransferase family 92 protein [Brachyspira intermedia]|uniref:glycosyltransferase family 92 protein n=1 Tax=Brachyspira intermedia TaxID=84377 RepID=UPI00300658F4
MFRNIFNTDTINRIVWFIPFKQLRNDTRDLLITLYDTYRRINAIKNRINFPDNNEPKDYISILSTVKNEAPYIKEWIEYHKLIGVERFYIYDNESTDNLKEVLEPYIKEGIVIYNFFAGVGKQLDIYEDGIDRYGKNTFWMAIIDLDEFIVPVENYDLKDFLKSYEKYPAIAVNWIQFDGNDHVEKPKGLVIENYKRAFKLNHPLNQITKSIVQPKYVMEYLTAHHFQYFNGFAVNENFEYSKERDMPNSVKKIRIHHYATKSLEEYKSKINKKDNDGIIKNNMWMYKAEDSYIDNTIDKYIPELKKRLNMD